jgi:hypothetical protein
MKNKSIIGIEVGSMFVGFAKDMNETERKSEVKRYRNYYSNKKDNLGVKLKFKIIYC